MKTTVRISALVLFIIALASCSSVDVMKRRYTNGFYVNHSGKKNNKSKENEKAGNKAEESVAVNNADKSVAPQVQPSELPAEATVVSEEKKAEFPVATGQAVKSSGEKPAEVKSEKHFITYTRQEAKQLKYGAEGSGEANIILLVILSILLPPLAVYLKNGVDKWFWATLILCLLAVLGVWLFYLGSLWFIAFIIALLVVLDVLA